MPRQRNLPFPRRRAKQPKEIQVSIRDRRALGVYVKRFLKGLQSSPDPQRTAKRGLAALLFPYPQREAMQGLGALTSVSASAVVFDVARRTVQEPQQCLDFEGLSSIALDVAKASRWLDTGNQDPIHNESALRVLAGGICELLTDPWAGNALMAVKNLARYPPLYAAALAFCTVERLAAKSGCSRWVPGCAAHITRVGRVGG